MATPDHAEEQGIRQSGQSLRQQQAELRAGGARPAGEAAPEDERMEEEEKILAGRSDVNMPALLTRDVHGG